MATTVSWELVTARGAPIRTFDDAEKARAWARANHAAWPGMRLEAVSRTEIRRELDLGLPRAASQGVVHLSTRRQS